MNKLSEDLKWRGFIHQTTYDDLSTLDKQPISFYFGVDPSADSMTIGNLAAAMFVRHLIDAGHNAYLLVGGATGMIGDPDGKADERLLKTLNEIAKNRQGIAAQYTKIFRGKQFTMVDNYDWFKDMKYLDFLRLVGKKSPLSQMLGRDFIQKRLGSEGAGISYAEFSYSLIQGYDFVHLNRTYGVTLQLCGADQWGNSVAGIDLLRRLDNVRVDVCSMPLVVNKATGRKFGKTEDGAIWLDPQRTSIYKFYQFWLNVDDKGVMDYIKIYTLLSREDIEEIATAHKKNPSARTAQKKLAECVTDLVHGEDQRISVQKVTSVLFSQADVTSLTNNELEALEKEIPCVDKGQSVIETLVAAGVVKTKSAARRLLEEGGVSVNNQKCTEDYLVNSLTLIKKGKNTFILVR